VVVALILMGLVVGVLSGFALQIIMTTIGAILKGMTKEWTTAVVEEGMTDDYRKPTRLRAGAIRGLWTGLVAGVLMAVSTVIGIVRFF
jgi:hypothetical protein